MLLDNILRQMNPIHSTLQYFWKGERDFSLSFQNKTERDNTKELCHSEIGDSLGSMDRSQSVDET